MRTAVCKECATNRELWNGRYWGPNKHHERSELVHQLWQHCARWNLARFVRATTLIFTVGHHPGALPVADRRSPLQCKVLREEDPPSMCAFKWDICKQLPQHLVDGKILSREQEPVLHLISKSQNVHDVWFAIRW